MKKIKEKELKEEIKIMLKDFFIAEYENTEEIVMLLNGQRFLISVKELK